MDIYMFFITTTSRGVPRRGPLGPRTGHRRTRLPFFFFFGLRLILGGKLDVERREDLLFFGLHLILGGKLDVERRGDLFFGLHPCFQWKRKQETAPPPLFKFVGTPLTRYRINKLPNDICFYGHFQITEKIEVPVLK